MNIKEAMNIYYQTTNIPITYFKMDHSLYHNVGSKNILVDYSLFPFEKLTLKHYFSYVVEEEVYLTGIRITNDLRDGFFLIGPYRFNILSKKEVESDKSLEQFLRLNPNFPIMKRGSTAKHLKLLEILFRDTTRHFLEGDSSTDLLEEVESNLVEYRSIDFYHHDYFIESNVITNIFRYNNVNLFKSSLREIRNQGNLTSLQTKYLHIVGIGLFCRKTIELGVSPHIVFTISDTYLRKLENTENLSDFDVITHECFNSLYRQIQKHNTRKYSKMINDVLMYIEYNLSKRFTLNDVAKKLKVDISHLSRSFKKETGIGFSRYVLSQKIKESKRLLRYSNYSLSEISGILGFSSKSYFIQSFKKIENITPVDYKNSL